MKSHGEKRSRRSVLSWSLAAILATLFALAMPGRSLAGPGPGNDEPPMPGNITGIVIAGDRVVPEAYVFLVNSTGHIIRRAQTDGEGRFAFRDIRPGRYVVRAEKREVGVGRAEVTLRPGATAHTRVLLRRP